MPKTDCTKLHFAIAKIFLEAKGVITARQIIEKLDLRYDLHPDRKTVYATLLALDSFVPIEQIRGPRGGYRRMDVKGGCEDA